MPSTLKESDWELLLGRIKDGECTPFLGAGACSGVFPLASRIAQQWAGQYNYPLGDCCDDLARVAQFLAVEYDQMFPKGKIRKLFRNVKPPDFKKSEDLHGIISGLPLPVYITTNYDDLLVQALQSRNKDPKQELCRWNKYLKKLPSIFESESGFNPTPANPVVFHFHGHYKIPQSLVLTEDDYLDFLVNISKDQDLLPPRIRQAWAGTSLLFLGYRLADWDFRVLFRSLVTYLERSIGMSHVSVQLVPGEEGISAKQKQKAQEYLNSYFGRLDIRVYWGTCREFSAELKRRWEDFCNVN